MVFTLPYNDNLMIRLASLVDQLDTNVRSQALLLKSRRCKQSFSTVREEVKKSGSGDKYTIGSKLVSFMVERELIKLISCVDIENRYEDLCGVMNKLQHQAFQINSQFLKYLLIKGLYLFCFI